MNNLCIKFSLLILFICVLSGSLLAQTHSVDLTDPTCTTCSNGQIDGSWDFSGYPDRVILDYPTGSSRKVTSDSFSFQSLPAGDYTLTYQYYGPNLKGKGKSKWRDFEIETVTLVVSVYCFPEATSQYEYISRVQLGSIDKSSGWSGYTDYTVFPSISTEVVIETDYSLTVTVGNYDDDYYSVWVDWNHDLDFDDPGEIIVSNGWDGNPVFTTTITPPANAVLGDTRMRVRINYETATACENSEWGEVEDYTLNVIAGDVSPVAICKNHTVQVDAAGNASISVADINDGSTDVETTDADLIFSLDKTDFNCSDIGNNTVTLTVEDGAGNISTCTATVTVEDERPPSLLNLMAEYYKGINFGESKFTESVTEINTNWGNNSPNMALLGNDDFSVRYSGDFVVPKAGDYTFYTNSDDGVRLIIDGSSVINNWTNHAPTSNSGTVNLNKGVHTITLEYYENTGGAVVELEWSSSDVGILRQVFSESSIVDNTIVEVIVQVNASGEVILDPATLDPGYIDACGINSRMLSKTNFTYEDLGDNFVVLTVKDNHGNTATHEVKVTVEEKPKLTFSPVPSTIYEGVGTAVIKASLNKISSKEISFEWCTEDLTAIKATDYNLVGWTKVTIPAGELSVDLHVTIIDDDIHEVDEEFIVFNKNVINAISVADRINCTIIDDDDPLPSLSISDISVDEGDGVATFEVRLNTVSSKEVSFQWITFGGSASQTNDYIPKPWTLVTIPAGQVSLKLEVTIIDDTEHEPDENFICDLRSITNATFLKKRAYCTIVDNENSASIEINTQDASVGSSPEKLVQNVLVTGCLTAKNITFSGDKRQIGYFNQGDSNFPLAEGIILSTGNVADAIGPNDESDISTGFDGDGDSDLTTIAERNSRDASVLEFDFKPAGDVVQFRYVFASDEYSEYACSNFNDVFAFLLSGPDINDGTKAQAKNIALLDDGKTPVMIKNVHGYERDATQWKYVEDVNGAYNISGRRYHREKKWIDKSSCPPENSHLFVDNKSRERIVYQGERVKDIYFTEGSYDIEYDGRTVILTATYTGVTECEWYHIKLAIADVGDDSYDSAVFLEAKSFKSNEVQVDNMIGDIEGDLDVMYEGCDGSFMRFTRNEDYDINDEINFDIDVSGTASNQVDASPDFYYTDVNGKMIGDGSFPSSITIPAGKAYVDYHYKALEDADIEVDETIIFRIDKCPCDGSEYFEKTVKIINSPKVNGVASAAIKCVGGGNPIATITVQLADGMDSKNYLYSFDGGLTFDANNVKSIVGTSPDGSDLVGKSFSIVVKDLFSCGDNTLNMKTTIPNISPVTADAGGNRKMCLGSGIQLMGKPAPYCEWSCSSPGIIKYLKGINESNPWVANDIPVGVYEFTLKVQDKPGVDCHCNDIDKMVLTVQQIPVISSVIAGKYELCPKEKTTLHADVSMPVSYVWNPANGLDKADNSNPVFSADVISEESRSFTLTVTSIDNGCSAVANLDQAIMVYPNPTVSLNVSESNLCSNGSNGEIKVNASGGTPKLTVPLYDFSWNPAAVNSDHVTGLAPNLYTVTVIDDKGCKVSLETQIKSQPKPIGIFFE